MGKDIIVLLTVLMTVFAAFGVCASDSGGAFKVVLPTPEGYDGGNYPKWAPVKFTYQNYPKVIYSEGKGYGEEWFLDERWDYGLFEENNCYSGIYNHYWDEFDLEEYQKLSEGKIEDLFYHYVVWKAESDPDAM